MVRRSQRQGRGRRGCPLLSFTYCDRDCAYHRRLQAPCRRLPRFGATS
jgi:hypothetical protein